MNGLSALSDDQLRSLYQQHQDAPDLSKVSDSDLKAMYDAHNTSPAPDKYQQAALDEQTALKANGGDEGAGFARRIVHGWSLGADSTALAGLETPLEMIKRGTINPAEGYRYAKAREDQIMSDARQNTGLLGTGAEILGGGMAGAGLANAGVTAGRFLGQNAGTLARLGASTADAAGLGAVAGANEGDGLQERAANAIKGGAAGLVAGPAAFVGGKALGAVGAPIFANIKARVNPAGYAEGQVSRAIHESGVTPDEIARRVQQAQDEGQGVYTVGDAMGNAGQRMLRGVASGPGEGRTAIVNALDSRQAGQGERLADAIDTSLGTGATARQAKTALTERARADSAPLYAKAMENPAWSERLQQFWDDPVMKQGLREGVSIQRLEALAANEKFNPRDAAITGFNDAGDPIISGVPNMRTINIAKKGIDNILEGYRDPVTGRLNLDERGRAIEGVRKSFLNEVDSLNPDYAAARGAYAGPAQVREAVGTGQKMAARGRAADNIQQFDSMPTAAQQGVRSGYADNLLGKIENSAIGVDKSRPLLTPKRQQELTALSLHNGPYKPGEVDPFQRQVGREKTMFETRHAALGGSKTDMNLADSGALGVDPHVVGQILTGNWHGAVRSVLSAGHNAMTGNTPQVRREVANILLQNGGNISAHELRDMVNRTVARIQFVQSIARNVGRGAAGGLAVAVPSVSAGANRGGR